MKKLIAIVACLALVGSFSIAACAESVSVGSAVEGMTTTYDAETGCFTTTVNANVGEQATILAFTGETLRTDNGTNIEFINQESKGETTSFTYMMKSDVVEGAVYTVKIGGTDVETPYSQKITIPTSSQEPTTATVKGTIVDPALVEAGMDFDYVESEAGKEIADYFREAWTTTVYLVADDAELGEEAQHEDAAAFLLYYFGESSEKPTGVVDPVIVDPTSGTYSFEGIASGNYILIAERSGALPILSYVSVNDGDTEVTIPTKTLINGDADLDSNVGSGDINEIVNNAPAAYFDGDAGYSPIIDADCDWNIGSGDINIVVKNSGADLFAYNEKAIEDVFALFN